MTHSFSKHYGVHSNDIEFVDIPVNDEDLLAFICPFLIENNKSDKVISAISKKLKRFLTELNSKYIIPNDRIGGLRFLDHLHEPNEYHLGYSSNNKGKAVASSKEHEIFQALRNNRFARKGVSVTNEAQNVLLLVEGIGQDIMSDIIANVCRDIFAKFTTNICNKYSIKTKKVTIEYYNDISKKWETKKEKLPCNEEHIILVPNNLVSGIRAYSNRYNWFISSNYISKEIVSNGTPENSKMIREMKDRTEKLSLRKFTSSIKNRSMN